MKILTLLTILLLGVSCSKQDTPDPREAKRKIAEQKIEQAQAALTIDEWWARNWRRITDERERLETEWKIKRAKQVLNIFKGDDGSKLPYKTFAREADELQKNPVEQNPSDDVITKTYADYINWFAFRNDIPPYKALRYDYLLTSQGLNLLQFDLLLYRIGISRNISLGVPLTKPQPKGNEALVPLKSGITKPKQTPQMTEEEQGFVKLCKTVVNDVWIEK